MLLYAGTNTEVQGKNSCPLLDRIDIHIDAPPVKFEKLTEAQNNGEISIVIRERVQRPRDKQLERYINTSITLNVELTNKTIKEYCQLSENCLNLLRFAVNKTRLSGRSYYRTIKLSRAIADLENSDEIKQKHIAEALHYRPKIDPAFSWR